jgi:hypothetical protein
MYGTQAQFNALIDQSPDRDIIVRNCSERTRSQGKYYFDYAPDGAELEPESQELVILNSVPEPDYEEIQLLRVKLGIESRPVSDPDFDYAWKAYSRDYPSEIATLHYLDREHTRYLETGRGIEDCRRLVASAWNKAGRPIFV